MDLKGQFTVEYLLILGFSVLVVFSIIPYVYDANELNTCMAAARTGALEGFHMDSIAFYPDEKFRYYTDKYPRLKSDSKIVLIKINYTEMGYDKTYKKTKIILKIVASAPSLRYADERYCMGERINYHVRRSICKAFKTEYLSNTYYNPAFSDRYMFTTYAVDWV
jgi:hypothetical protein